jgi:thiamine biosynthesis protein ThiI
MLSGGIDSPVAGFMMAKRGLSMDAVHFESHPYTSQAAMQKVVALYQIIKQYAPDMRLYVVRTTAVQEAIKAHCDSYRITLLRCAMMSITEVLCDRHNAHCIVNGESLAQVASQTLDSIAVTSSMVTLPVLRPLIGMDKQQIIDIAQTIGTYNTSILPYEDCCTVFMPKRPVIKPTIEQARYYEDQIPDWCNILESAIAQCHCIAC